MCAGRDLGERDSHQMQKWGASEGSVSKVLLGVNRNNRKDVGRQTGCPVRVLRGSPTTAHLGTASRGFGWCEDQRPPSGVPFGVACMPWLDSLSC